MRPAELLKCREVRRWVINVKKGEHLQGAKMNRMTPSERSFVEVLMYKRLDLTDEQNARLNEIHRRLFGR